MGTRLLRCPDGVLLNLARNQPPEPGAAEILCAGGAVGGHRVLWRTRPGQAAAQLASLGAAGVAQNAGTTSAPTPKPRPAAPVASDPVFVGRTMLAQARAEQTRAVRAAAAVTKENPEMSKLAQAQVARMGTAQFISLGDVFGGLKKVGGAIFNRGRDTRNVPGPAGLPCVPGTPGCGGSFSPVVPNPGLTGAVQRLLPGGNTGFHVPMTVEAGMTLACPAGFHPNKSNYYTRAGFVAKGTKCVRNRKRNPLNHRALTKATSRIAAYARTQSRAEKAIKKAARTFR